MEIPQKIIFYTSVLALTLFTPVDVSHISIWKMFCVKFYISSIEGTRSVLHLSLKTTNNQVALRNTDISELTLFSLKKYINS